MSAQSLTNGTLSLDTLFVRGQQITGGASGVQSVNQASSATAGVYVDNTDPANPVISLNIVDGTNISIQGATPPPGAPAGLVSIGIALDVVDTGVQYNKGGALTGDTNFTYDETTTTLSVPTVEPTTIRDSVGSAGSAGQVLTAGAGSQVLWGTPVAGGAGGSNTQVQFNSGGVFAGSSNFTFTGGNTLSVPLITAQSVSAPNNLDLNCGVGDSIYLGGPLVGDPTSPNFPANVYLQVPKIVDNGASAGTSGQVLTAGTGSQLVWATPPAIPAVKQATYYKTVAQNLTSGNTDITFDAVGSWNNPGGYITHVSGSADFTVVQTGLYQLEFHSLVLLNGASWTQTTNKVCAIDITRSPLTETAVVAQSSLQAIAGYTQSVNATYYLVAGDVINCRLANTFTGGPPEAQCLTTTFDLNTFFSWTFIS
jgi:hypothetical protein